MVADCQIDIAARGWDHDGWVGTFYPEDLPREWRLSYYANNYRAVLVPDNVLIPTGQDQLLAWDADTYADFQFYLEITDRLLDAGNHGLDVQLFLDRTEPIQHRIGGVLARVSGARASHGMEDVVAALNERFPVNLLQTAPKGGKGGPLSPWSAGSRLGSGQCWSPGVDANGLTHPGCMGYLEQPPRELRLLRHHVEEFIRVVAGCERAVLCFGGRPPTIETMQNATVIAELLGG